MVTRRQFPQGATSLALLGSRFDLQTALAATGDRAAPAVKGAATTAGGWTRHDRPPSFGYAAS